MSIETELLINKEVTMQLKVINDELYEMMWELHPTHDALVAIKEKLGRLVDKVWEEYKEQLQPTISTSPKPYQHEAAI